MDTTANRNGEPTRNSFKKLSNVILALLPVPVTSILALVTGIDAIALPGVILGCILAHFLLRRQQKNWGDVGFTRPVSWPLIIVFALVAAVCLLFITSVLGTPVNYLTGTTPDISKFDVLRGNVAVLIAGLFIVWTTAAFGEELLFRGFVMNELKDLIAGWNFVEKTSWIFALLVTSVLFGLAHAYQGWSGIILTGIAGLGYGIVYFLRKRNLWASILTHGLYDTIAFFLVFANYDKLIVMIADKQ